MNKSIVTKEEDDDNSNTMNEHPKQKKKYSVITQEVREKFIKRVISREVTIKEAAKEFGIKFSTSKAILQTFKREGRIGKKKTRQRKPRTVKKTQSMIDQSNVNKSSSSIGKTQSQQHKTKEEAVDVFDPDMRNEITEMQSMIQKNLSPILGPMSKQQYPNYNNVVNNQQQNQGIILNGINNQKNNQNIKNQQMGSITSQQQQQSKIQGQQHRHGKFTNNTAIYINPFIYNSFNTNNQKEVINIDMDSLKQQLKLLTVEKLKSLALQKEEEKTDMEFNYAAYFQIIL